MPKHSFLGTERLPGTAGTHAFNSPWAQSGFACPTQNEVSLLSPNQIEHILNKVHATCETCRSLAIPQRFQILKKLFKLLAENRDQFINLLIYEAGKNRSDAEGEFNRAGKTIQAAIAVAKNPQQQSYAADSDESTQGKLITTVDQPQRSRGSYHTL